MEDNNVQIIEREMVTEYSNKDAIRPDGSVKKWNWGAFTFSLWWGIANRVWLSFLMLIPIFHIVWVFILAYNGNKWAYEKFIADGHKGTEKFNYAQKTWNSAGFWAFIVAIAALILWIIFVMIVGIAAYSAFNNYGYSSSYWN